MEPKLQRLSLTELQDIFIKETKGFLNALERGETWKQLESRRDYLKIVTTIIDAKVDIGSTAGSADAPFPCL